MSTVLASAITKAANVCGGAACVRQMRIPVWLLVLKRELGASDESVLRSYPDLTADDLDAAWEYYRENPLEIERAIWLNDTAANVVDGGPVPAGVIVEGKLLGLDDRTIRAAFDPPLPEEAVAAAWREYRADPGRVSGPPPSRPRAAESWPPSWPIRILRTKSSPP